MPGPTGGGRSGGGGIGGGARGGGFSGGSHGGFSSGSHRSFGSGAHRPVGGFYNLNTNNNDPEQEKKNNVKGIIFLIISLVAIFGGPAASLVGNVISDFGAYAEPDIWAEVDSVILEDDDWDSEYYITPVEGERTKLDESLCTPIDTWFEDHACFLANDDAVDDLDAALKYFYELTGVQPYLIILDNIDGICDPDWETIDNYLFNRYIELFGEDEGHYIFLYFMNTDGTYTTWYCPGLYTMRIMDDNAYYILTDYLNMYYYESTTRTEMFELTFISTAENIMRVNEDAFVTVPVDSGYAEMTTYPPASTVPPAEVDSSVDVTVPAVELTSEPESDEAETAEPESAVESTGTTVEVTPTQESTTEILWEDDVYEEPEEDFISSEALGAIFVIAVAVTAFVVFVLWNKKKMRDLENDM